MKIHNYDNKSGEYLSTDVADESPLEPGIYIIPASATEIEPPESKEGFARIFNMGMWEFITDKRGTKYWLEDGSEYLHDVLGDIPSNALTTKPEPTPPTAEQIQEAVTAARAAAYVKESDPLFFKYQRGEVLKEDWLAKVAEIKARYPDGVLPVYTATP